MNNAIAELCMEQGTIIFHALNINSYIEQLCNKWGTYVYHV